MVQLLDVSTWNGGLGKIIGMLPLLVGGSVYGAFYGKGDYFGIRAHATLLRDRFSLRQYGFALIVGTTIWLIILVFELSLQGKMLDRSYVFIPPEEFLYPEFISDYMIRASSIFLLCYRMFWIFVLLPLECWCLAWCSSHFLLAIPVNLLRLREDFHHIIDIKYGRRLLLLLPLPILYWPCWHLLVGSLSKGMLNFNFLVESVLMTVFAIRLQLSYPEDVASIVGVYVTAIWMWGRPLHWLVLVQPSPWILPLLLVLLIVGSFLPQSLLLVSWRVITRRKQLFMGLYALGLLLVVGCLSYHVYDFVFADGRYSNARMSCTGHTFSTFDMETREFSQFACPYAPHVGLGRWTSYHNWRGAFYPSTSVHAAMAMSAPSSSPAHIALHQLDQVYAACQYQGYGYKLAVHVYPRLLADEPSPTMREPPPSNDHEPDGHSMAAQPNVVMFMNDALSSVHAARALPQTMEALRYIRHRRMMEVIHFPFFHVVGVNSLPNQIPMLTAIDPMDRVNGSAATYSVKSTRPFYRHGNASEWIWNVAKGQGYETAFDDDMCTGPEQSTFGIPMSDDATWTAKNYRMFCHPWWKTYSVHAKCLAGKSSMLQLMDNLEANLRASASRRKPLFSFTTNNVPHEETGEAISRADGAASRKLLHLARSGLLDNTVLLWMSDHGENYHKHLPEFYQAKGKVHSHIAEHHWPSLFILVGKNVVHTYPKQIAQLVRNRYQLVSPYYLHGTMVDIMTGLGNIRTSLYDTDPVRNPPTSKSLFTFNLHTQVPGTAEHELVAPSFHRSWNHKRQCLLRNDWGEMESVYHPINTLVDAERVTKHDSTVLSYVADRKRKITEECTYPGVFQPHFLDLIDFSSWIGWDRIATKEQYERGE